jgi:hypothetical protein
MSVRYVQFMEVIPCFTLDIRMIQTLMLMHARGRDH